MREITALNYLRALASVGSALLLFGCGPVFAVRNNSDDTVYIDTIYKNDARRLAPQALEKGKTYSAPVCWNDIAKVYIGKNHTAMREAPVYKLCRNFSCNCTVNTSDL